MFRSLAALLFIVVIQPLAALVAYLTIRALDLSGITGFLVGFPVFVGLLTAAVMVLAMINERINSKEHYPAARQSTRVKGAH